MHDAISTRAVAVPQYTSCGFPKVTSRCPVSIVPITIAIPRMGVAEFSRKVKKSKSDVDKFLRGERNLKPDTLNEYLIPFNFRIKVTLEKVA